MMKQEAQSLTTGNVPQKILSLAFPIFCSNLFQQLYNAADSLIVGQFIGQQALAAVSSSSSLIYLLAGFINGVSIGAGVLVARFYGAKDEEHLQQTIHTTIALGIVAGIALTIAGIIFTPQILQWMGTPKDVIDNSTLYFRIYFLGSSAVVLYNMEASILQAVGNSRSPMIYLILASLTNIFLDLLFIAVFRWGVGSAALATIISQAFSAFLAFYKLTHTAQCYQLKWRKISFIPDILRQVVSLGIPSGVQNSVIALANVIVQTNINAFGSIAMAGCGAYNKIEGFAFLPVTCFSLSLSTFVSQNVGAKRYDRVRSGIKFSIFCSPILAEIIGVLIYIFAPFFISLFNSDPLVVSFGVNYARTVSLFYCLLSFSHCCSGILRGLGRPIIPMAIMLSVWCVFRIIYITVAVHIFPNIYMVYWAYPITWAISAFIFAILLHKLSLPQDQSETIEKG